MGSAHYCACFGAVEFICTAAMHPAVDQRALRLENSCSVNAVTVDNAPRCLKRPTQQVLPQRCDAQSQQSKIPVATSG